MPFKKGQSGNPGGKPKGAKNKSTISKEQANAAVREFVLTEMRPMLEAQAKSAKGISFMVYRNKKTGKFRAVPKAKHEAILSDEEMEVEVWEERPSTPAFADLMNRALGKPAEQPIQLDVAPGGILERLIAARKRANG